MMKCDPNGSTCPPSNQDQPVDAPKAQSREGWTIHYVGDPMCSWCWGIAPTLSEVAEFCRNEGIGFSLTMGGLRAGGGEPWNPAFKNFLRNEWLKINQTTGQPFGYSLLDAPHFDYDTEPACRAVTTVRLLQDQNHLPNSTALPFFSAIQKKFYVEGADPKLTKFYASICDSLTLDFEIFKAAFESPEAKQAVQQDFSRSRHWDVRSFPTLLLERSGRMEPLVVGYATTEQILSRLRQT